MTSPPKPWEPPSNYQRFDPEKDLLKHQSSAPSMEPVVGTTRGGISPPVVRNYGGAPQIPPRPSMLSRPGYPGIGAGPHYNGYNRMYNMTARSYNGNFGGLGSYGSYSNYGNFGNANYGGYGSYGQMQNLPENRLVQMAEESSRPAFESIESLVRAFGSISFMLESTYDTIHNSFRAVLDVAENVGRMRNVFSQIFSAFGIIRAIQWLYRKALYLLGLRSFVNDQLWNEAASSTTKELLATLQQDTLNKKTSWGGLVLLSILLTGPYIIWKIMNSLNLKVNTHSAYNYRQWLHSPNTVYRGLTLYDFDACNDQELSFKAQQKVIIAPRELQTWGKNWMLVYSVETKKYGIVPCNYVKVNEIIRICPKNSANAQTAPGLLIHPASLNEEMKMTHEELAAGIKAKPNPLMASLDEIAAAVDINASPNLPKDDDPINDR